MKASTVAKRSKKYLRRFMQVDPEKYTNWGQLGALLNYMNKVIAIFGKESIVGYYPFKEESGTVAYDIVNSRNATYSGVTLNQAGFDSNNKSISLPNLTSVVDFNTEVLSNAFPRSEGTLSLYVKFPDGFWDSALEPIIASFYLYSGDYVTIRKLPNAHYLTAYVRSNNVIKQLTDVYQYSLNWMQITLTWSVANSNVSLYINGLKVAEDTDALNPLSNDAFFRATVGNSGTPTASTLGNYSHVLLLNRPASSDEVFSAFKKNGSIVFEGDSRMVYYRRIPFYSLDLIAGKNYASVNNSVPGSTISAMSLRGANVDAMIKQGTTNLLVVFCSVNNSELTAQQLYDGLKDYCIARKEAGFKVIICTEIDAQDVGRIEDNWHTKYITLNNLIKADSSFADAVADFGAIPEAQDATNTTWFNEDKVHQTLALSMKMSEVLSTAISSLT
jgi:hypothetical protein